MPSDTTNSTIAPAKKRVDIGQILSRQFNFVFVLSSAILLIFWPSIHSDPTLVGRLGWFLAAVLADVAIVQGFKRVCYFPRPNSGQKWEWKRRAHSGFPSGHTLPAFLFATLISHQHPQLAIWWFAGAALIAWGRWNVRAHFAIQILLSALLGVGLGLIFSHFQP